MRKVFAVHSHKFSVELSLLLVRVVCGCAFLQHGWGKIQHPFAWMGEQAQVPGFLQALAALSEFGGGMALIVGLLTRLAGLGITCTMMVAVATHRFILGDPFVNPQGGHSYELASVYLTIAILLVTYGPGRLSLDRWVFGKRT